jgi:hypothetical protein
MQVSDVILNPFLLFSFDPTITLVILEKLYSVLSLLGRSYLREKRRFYDTANSMKLKRIERLVTAIGEMYKFIRAEGGE